MSDLCATRLLALVYICLNIVGKCGSYAQGPLIVLKDTAQLPAEEFLGSTFGTSRSQAVHYETISGELACQVCKSLANSVSWAKYLQMHLWTMYMVCKVVAVRPLPKSVFGPLRWLRRLAYAGAIIYRPFLLLDHDRLLRILCTPTSGHSPLAYQLATTIAAMCSPRDL